MPSLSYVAWVATLLSIRDIPVANCAQEIYPEIFMNVLSPLKNAGIVPQITSRDHPSTLLPMH
jgi:hypothetical protein